MYVTFNDYWPYCYFIVRGMVMTSGHPSSMLIWVGVSCGITFEFLGQLMWPGRR